MLIKLEIVASLAGDIFESNLSWILDSTEPANSTSSYTRVGKRIVDTEIAMQQSSRTTLLTTSMQTLSLLKRMVSPEQEEEGRLGN